MVSRDKNLNVGGMVLYIQKTRPLSTGILLGAQGNVSLLHRPNCSQILLCPLSCHLILSGARYHFVLIFCIYLVLLAFTTYQTLT